MQEKKSIYFSRKYRHLSVNIGRFLIFMLLFVLPVLVVLILSLNKLTHFICNICLRLENTKSVGITVLRSMREGSKEILKAHSTKIGLYRNV